MHGLTRALAANAVQGVSTGFTRELDIVGIGYRCDMKGRIATFTLGYSHPIEFYLPDGVDMKVDKQTHLVLTGADRQMLGQVAANMRALRPPDPYKNKGVRYTGEAVAEEGRQDRRVREASRVTWHAIRKMTSALRIHTRIRRRVKGTPERPRLAVFRSVKHIYAQVIDDSKGHTLVAASSTEKNGIEERRQCRRRESDRQAGGGAGQGQRASKRWCSIAADICITAA